MSEIEKIKGYIKRHGAPCNPRYDMSMNEVLAIAHKVGGIEAVCMAFVYGKTKGYRAAKAEAKRG